MSAQLERIIAEGNRSLSPAGVGARISNKITCKDGFKMSVIAGGGTYSSPRYAEHGPFEAVEVGFPSLRPEPWDTWAEYAENEDEPTQTVYGWVPVQLVRDLIEAHGGAA